MPPGQEPVAQSAVEIVMLADIFETKPLFLRQMTGSPATAVLAVDACLKTVLLHLHNLGWLVGQR